MIRLWRLFYLLPWMILFLACSGRSSPTLAPTMAVDEVCQGMIDVAFISTSSYFLGENEAGPVYGPYIVSFLQDGRVVWKYGVEASIGTFTCEKGAFTATFPEGEKRSMSGTYSAETETIRIEGVNYLKETEE